MREINLGNFGTEGIEVVERQGLYFVRYDAGAHAIAWREDEISEAELKLIAAGGDSCYTALIDIQRRLEAAGVNPYIANWSPPSN